MGLEPHHDAARAEFFRQTGAVGLESQAAKAGRPLEANTVVLPGESLPVVLYRLCSSARPEWAAQAGRLGRCRFDAR